MLSAALKKFGTMKEESKSQSEELKKALHYILCPDEQKPNLKRGFYNDPERPYICSYRAFNPHLSQLIDVPEDSLVKMRHEEILETCSSKLSETFKTLKDMLELIIKDKETNTSQEMIEKIKNDLDSFQKYQEYSDALLKMSKLVQCFDRAKGEDNRTDKNAKYKFNVMFQHDNTFMFAVHLYSKFTNKENHQFAIDVIEGVKSLDLIGKHSSTPTLLNRNSS